MHLYQKHILDLLRSTETLRYSDLRPDDVESSHFKYHLDQLIKDGLVTRKDRGLYSLTTKGKASVDRLSRGRVNPNASPKVITYTLLQDDSSYYLLRKDKAPYLGLLNMVGGKVHNGESSEDAARREVREKTGLDIDKVQLAAIANIRIAEGDNLLTHAIAYVFTAQVDYANDLEAVAIEDVMLLKDAAPDLLPILKKIKGKALAILDMHIAL
jgi:ADP-ribose pyrophosphatase YjhB (NUDIX family)